ncbi:MAG: glycosyltransferase family 39 protein [Anaerolineae bacterium]|nr:glycosyltransferase family 39 protein [Anaerolineae bacterium]
MSQTTHWTGIHWAAVGLCLVAFTAAGAIATYLFERVPHLEDEVAYLFQAQVFAAGKTHTQAVLHSNCFFAPFVLDYEGRRFAKYTPGWSALLATGVKMGQPWWVNAACAALTIALIFRLGCEINDTWTGGLAAALAVTSPFVLLLSGSLMSHTSCLVFTTAFLLCFKRTFDQGRAMKQWALAGGAMLGMAFVIRPYTAVAIAVPAALYTLWRLGRYGEWERLWFIGLGVVPLALVVPLFNAIWTGDPLLSPYVLFWPYDRIGFGPGHGPQPEGNTLWIGLGEAVLVIGRLANWLHGWPGLSLVFVICTFLFKPRRFWDLFLAGTALVLILAYVLYWTNGDLFGPRYTYEIVSALFVLSAAGIVRVWHWARRKNRWQVRLLGGVLALLLAIDLLVYLPWQWHAYHNLFGISAASKTILEQAGLDNALVIVHTGERGWKDYAVPFSMNAPELDGSVVYASECPPMTQQLIDQFAEREVYYFDGQQVWPFVTSFR